ncbi:MAG TPA: DUF3887 domain-containing protein, partial [Armatimonadota bacterium]
MPTIVLTTERYYWKIVSMRNTIASLVFELLLLCMFPTACKTAPLKPDEISRQFIQCMVSKDYKTAVTYFDDTMREALPVAKLQFAWEGTMQQAGLFQRQLESHIQQFGRFQIVEVVCQFERSQITVRISINDAGKI